jgi:hypothetical protein
VRALAGYTRVHCWYHTTSCVANKARAAPPGSVHSADNAYDEAQLVHVHALLVRCTVGIVARATDSCAGADALKCCPQNQDDIRSQHDSAKCILLLGIKLSVIKTYGYHNTYFCCDLQQLQDSCCCTQHLIRAHSPGPYQGLAELLALLPLTVRRAKTFTAPRCSTERHTQTHSSTSSCQIRSLSHASYRCPSNQAGPRSAVERGLLMLSNSTRTLLVP